MDWVSFEENMRNTAVILTKQELLLALSVSPPLLEGLIDPDLQIQPNGVDLSLSEVLSFKGAGSLDFTNSERAVPMAESLAFDTDGWVWLQSGCYAVRFNETVNLPRDLMAIGKPRSSLLRMGATVETAVWDAGYQGRSQSLLIVHNTLGIRLAKNARLVQLVFMKLSDSTDSYAGKYQREGI